MDAIWWIVLFAGGSSIGSFLCCQARRLHLKTAGKGKKDLGARSVCMKCKYQLKWYDNIPVISWLCLRGKCRKCGHKIGVAELISEVGMGCAFVMLGSTVNIALASPLEWAVFGATIVLAMVLGWLAIYDGMYGELPVAGLTIAIICAIIVLFLKEWSLLAVAPFSMVENVWKPVGVVIILGGLYLILYLVSKGKWVGDGDWWLGVVIGLTLMSPWLALVALCIMNILACVVMMPLLGRARTRKIHFGPFMVAAWVIVITLADVLSGLVR